MEVTVISAEIHIRNINMELTLLSLTLVAADKQSCSISLTLHSCIIMWLVESADQLQSLPVKLQLIDFIIIDHGVNLSGSLGYSNNFSEHCQFQLDVVSESL